MFVSNILIKSVKFVLQAALRAPRALAAVAFNTQLEHGQIVCGFVGPKNISIFCLMDTILESSHTKLFDWGWPNLLGVMGYANAFTIANILGQFGFQHTSDRFTRHC